MHVRHVEVVALVAPAFVEDLLELLLRLEIHPQRRVRAGPGPACGGVAIGIDEEQAGAGAAGGAAAAAPPPPPPPPVR